MSPSENKLIPVLVILAGAFMTGVSIWLNFRPNSNGENSKTVSEKTGND